MSCINGRISNIGVALGANGRGDLQICFRTSRMNKSWFFIDNAANINKWARYKPFRYNGYFPDLFTDPNSARLAAAASVNYGLAAPAPQQDFKNTFGNIWSYTNPRGSAYNEPMRVQDFDGYYDLAAAPVDAIGDLDVYETAGDFDFSTYIKQNIAGGEAISWDDLAAIKDYYLCAIFSTTSDFSSGNLLAKTAASTFDQGGTALVITAAELATLRSNGYGYYYLVARSSALSGLQNPGTTSAYYIAMPAPHSSNELKGEFNIHASATALVTIASVSNVASPTRALDFLNASPYVGSESIGEPDTDFFAVPTHPYWLHFGLDIRAGSAAVTIGSVAKIRLTQTFNSPTGFSNPISCDVRDEDFNAVSQVTIPAGQTKRVYLIASGPLLGLTQNGAQGGPVTDNIRFSTGVELYQNSTLIDRNTLLRVRNFI